VLRYTGWLFWRRKELDVIYSEWKWVGFSFLYPPLTFVFPVPISFSDYLHLDRYLTFSPVNDIIYTFCDAILIGVEVVSL
jgi:hypothetical protein